MREGGNIKMISLQLQAAYCCNFIWILICNSLDILVELVGDMEELFITPTAGAVVNMEGCYRRPASAVPALYLMFVNLRNTGQSFNYHTFYDTSIFFHDY